MQKQANITSSGSNLPIQNIPVLKKSIFLNKLDKIYIINLKKNVRRKYLIYQQFVLFGLSNFLFIDAVNSHDKKYDKMYHDITKNLDKTFIKDNFQRGALGCLLSHKKCIEHAIDNKYNSILILEDDSLFRFNLDHIDSLINNKKLPENWDFVFLGKKEGRNDKRFNPKGLKCKYINGEIYIPGDFTWASHAWLIKNNVFHDLIRLYNNIDNPVDLIIRKIYNKYNFYTLENDLFISKLNDSDIRVGNSENNNVWNWNGNNFFSPEINTIKNIYVWGFTHSKSDNNHTHSYIHESIYISFKKYFPYLNVNWVENKHDPNMDYNNSLFFVSPTHGDYSELPINVSCYYIFHIDDFEDNLGLNSNEFKNTKYYKLIENKRGIILECRLSNNKNYNDYSIDNSTILLNWGVHYDFPFVSYILQDKINYYDKIKKNKYFAYHGSVWYLNVNNIINLSNSCENNKIQLLLSGRNRYHDKFKRYKYVTVEDFWKMNKPNTIDRLNQEYGLKSIIAIQGDEHIGNYISDRVFKYPLNGYISFTNNSLVKRHFPSVIYNDNINNLVLKVTEITNDENLYNNILKEQIKDIILKESTIIKINKMIDFLIQISNLSGKTFNFPNIHLSPKTIRFTNTINNENNFYNIEDNETLIKVNSNLLEYNNYLIDFDLKKYDFGLIYCIINRNDFIVEIDNNHSYKQLILDNINRNKMNIKFF